MVESLGMHFVGVPLDMHAPTGGEMDHVRTPKPANTA